MEKIKFIAVIVLLVVANTADATIIIMDDHVAQKTSLSVLGSTYTTSYSGRVDGVNPISRQNISLLFSENASGDEIFSGISTNLDAPNGEAFAYGLARSENFSFGYDFELNSDHWWTNGGSGLGGVEVFNSITQESSIDFDVDFRVDGIGDVLQVEKIIEDGRFGTVDFFLRDHTAGFGGNVDFRYELEDGHVYTLRALLANATCAEHTVEGDVLFAGDVAHVPEPSCLLIFSTGMLGVVGISRKKKNKE